MAVNSQGFAHKGQNAPIDAMSTGATTIYTVGNGFYFSPLFLTFETISVDAVTETVIVSVGIDSPNYDDLLFAHGLKPVEGAVEMVPIPLPSSRNTPLDVYVRVIRPASGTEMTFCAGIGYLVHGLD